MVSPLFDHSPFQLLPVYTGLSSARERLFFDFDDFVHLIEIDNNAIIKGNVTYLEFDDATTVFSSASLSIENYLLMQVHILKPHSPSWGKSRNSGH